MKHIQHLIIEATQYTNTYSIKYNIKEQDILNAIFYSHLTHLINK